MISVLETIHRGTVFTARLSDIERLRHLYVLGRPGMGKTGLLLNMIQQDVLEKKLFLCFDSKGIIEPAILATTSPAQAERLQYSFLGTDALGSFQQFVGRIQRVRQSAGNNDAFVSVYIDSLAQVPPGLVSEILARAQELNVALVLAHRYVSELPAELFGRIVDSVRYGIFFSMGPRDAERVAPWIPNIPLSVWGPQLKARQVFTNVVLGDSALPLFRAETIQFDFPSRQAQIETQTIRGSHGAVGVPDDVLRQLFAF